jgi:hypothetical protein
MDLQFLVEQPPIYEVLRQYLTDADKLILRYVVHGIERPKTPQLVSLVVGGDLKLADWAYKQWSNAAPCSRKCKKCSQLPGKAADAAVRHGMLEVVQWWITRNKNVAPELLRKATRYGQLEIVKCLYSRELLNKFKNKKEMIENAAYSGSIELVEWLVKDGHEVTKSATVIMAERGHVHLLEWAHLHKIEVKWSVGWDAAAAGRIDVLEWLHKHGKLKSYTMSYAAKTGRIDALEWMYKLGYRPCSSSVHNAIKHGQLRAAKWLLEKGAEWPCNIYAVAYGCDKTFKWVFDNGAPFDEDMCTGAVKDMYYRMLKSAQSSTS